MTNHFLYIDPGTGSMLFSLAIGIVTTLVFATRAAVVKIRFLLSGGKTAKISENKIPYLIYSDHKRYWNVFKPVCDEFERHKIPLVYYTQSADDPALSEKYEFVKAEFIGEGNRGLVRMNMQVPGQWSPQPRDLMSCNGGAVRLPIDTSISRTRLPT